MTGKTEKQICRGDFWKQSMEDTGWEVYASRILCLVKRISENGVSSNKNFHLHRKRIFYRKETVYNLYYKYAYKDRYNRTKEEVHKL